MADDSAAPTTEAQPEGAVQRPLSLLARETFGVQFKGEVREEQATPETSEPNGAAGDGEADPQHEASGDEAAEAEGAEAEEREGASEEGAGDEEVPISSVQELVEHQEWDPDWFHSLKAPVKVDGEHTEVPLKDLVANYQMNAAAEKRLEEAKAKAKSQSEELAKQSEALQGQFATAAKLIENAEKLLDSDTKAIDWQRLREDDPAEYSAKKAEVAERREQIDEMKREAADSYQKSVQEHQQQSQQQLQEQLQAEQATLLEKVPEWQEPETAKAEKAKLVEYLKDQGFTDQDVMGASDHRLVLIARKAMLYDQGQGKADAARKKVAKVPKTLKPGASKPEEQISQERVQHAQKRLHKSGSLDDAYAVLKARRGGN